MRSARGTFVVQIDDSASPSSDKLGGRIEHILSGEAVEFESPDALLEFIQRLRTVLPVASCGS